MVLALIIGAIILAVYIDRQDGDASGTTSSRRPASRAPIFTGATPSQAAVISTSTARPVVTQLPPTVARIVVPLIAKSVTPTNTPVPFTATPIMPTSSPVPAAVSTETPGGRFFESLKDLKESIANERPDIDLAEFAGQVHFLINLERQQRGLSPLAFEEKIAAIAQNHSSDMARNDFFEHDNLQGLSPTDRGAAVGYDCIKRYGSYYTFGLAENIYQAWLFSSTTYVNGVPIRNWYSQEEIAALVVQGWMDSPGHEENILTDTYDRAGIGVAVASDGKVYVTQDFC